jgi:hypothetical protein
MEREMDRRQFLGRVAGVAAVALGGGALVAACDEKGSGGPLVGGSRPGATSAGGTATKTPGTGGPTVFRLSTRRQRNACAACQAHAHNRVYATKEAAAANRAHRGCNCQIAAQPVDAATLSTMFTGGKTVHDKRWK